MTRLSFMTQFKIEILIPFTGCGKMPGKMSDNDTGNFMVSHFYPIGNSARYGKN